MTSRLRRRKQSTFPLANLSRASVAALFAGTLAGSLAWGQTPGQFPLQTPPPIRPEEILPPGAPQNEAPQLVADVQIRGLYMTPRHEAERFIYTRKDREFDPTRLQSDVRNLVGSNLFADVKTFTTVTPQGIIVVFEVLERPRVRYVRFLGNRGMGDSTLMKQCGIKVGDSINAFLTEEARRKMEEHYHTHGYPRTEITILEGDQQTDKGVVFIVNEGQLQRIENVYFEGNTIASDARLKTQIESKPGFLYYFFRGKIDRAKIDADVEKITIYYRNLGYFKARVGKELVFDESGEWATLKFLIDEGPRYVIRNVVVEGAEKFDGEVVASFMKLKRGEYFNQSAMARDVNTILDMYGSQGHVFADIAPETRFLEEPGILDVVYKVKEGGVFSVGEVNVKIAGEYPHTMETVVLNRLDIRPGDIIDIRKIRDAERRLIASSLFETNPSIGEPPKIVVRPPEFDEDFVANISQGYTVRGQDPEPRNDERPPQQIKSLRTGTTLYSMPEPVAQQQTQQPRPTVHYQPHPSPTHNQR